jgi:hypothetical protein
MIETKLFEIRDRATFIPVIASLMEVSGTWNDAALAEDYLLRRCGFRPTTNLIWMSRIQSHPEPASYAPYDLGGGPRTIYVAHDYIRTHWAELRSGAVIDVEFILGETDAPKRSEREEEYHIPPERNNK